MRRPAVGRAVAALSGVAAATLATAAPAAASTRAEPRPAAVGGNDAPPRATRAPRGRVEVMVVGRTRILAGPSRVVLRARRARVGGRSCALGRATALSALAGTRVSFALRDYGACSGAARDAGSLYVARIGPDRARGRDGWVYKVGHRSATAGAGDPTGPFGTGHGLRRGARVLWFWCVKDARDACQRTLDIRAPGSVAPGAILPVTVRGYDEQGRGVPVAGATVFFGGAAAVTGPSGVAALPVPAARGVLRVRAIAPRLVPAFPRRVRVG